MPPLSGLLAATASRSTYHTTRDSSTPGRESLAWSRGMTDPDLSSPAQTRRVELLSKIRDWAPLTQRHVRLDQGPLLVGEVSTHHVDGPPVSPPTSQAIPLISTPYRPQDPPRHREEPHHPDRTAATPSAPRRRTEPANRRVATIWRRSGLRESADAVPARDGRPSTGSVDAVARAVPVPDMHHPGWTGALPPRNRRTTYRERCHQFPGISLSTFSRLSEVRANAMICMSASRRTRASDAPYHRTWPESGIGQKT